MIKLKSLLKSSVTENIKISKGHGRGQSWTNYHDNNDNRLQVTKVGNEYTAYFSKAGVSGSKNSVLLRGLSKIDAAKLVKMAKTAGLEKTAKYGKSKYKKYVSEGKKITLGDKGRKFTLDIENEAQMFLYRLKKDKKKLTLKNFSDYIDAEYKFFNSPKLNQQVYNHIKKNFSKLSEGKLTEGKMVKLLLPVKDRKKVVHILQKQLKLKISKDFEYGGQKGSNFTIELDKKFENKVIELFMKSKIKVRG